MQLIFAVPGTSSKNFMLTDLISSSRLDPQGLGKKGYAWVGWKNDSNDMPPIEIIFKFDKVRNLDYESKCM